MTDEKLIRTESVRIPPTRDSYGSCMALAESIRDEGLRHPITLWQDGTLISGGRRLRAHMMLNQHRISAVFVHTIEDAAKRMLLDSQDPHLSLPWKWSEAAKLWELLRRLDAPAAAQRLDAARRRGVELRHQTQTGKRKPGRSSHRTDDYVLSLISEAFGISSGTAYRIEVVHRAIHDKNASAEKRELARQVMADIDATSNVYPHFRRLTGGRIAPVSLPRPVTPIVSAPGPKQLLAWDKALPQLEGLTTGLVELGPPNPGLTWDQVGPVRTRLMAVRRELEKIIKQMRESSKS